MNLSKITALAVLAASTRVLAGGAPTNDDCANAQVVTPGAYYGTTMGATGSGFTGCGVAADTPDVWFSFTPAFGGMVTINTAGSDFDTVLQTYLDGCLQTDQVGCGDDALYTPNIGESLASEITAFFSSAHTYLIRVAGKGATSGNFVLSISDPAVPPPMDVPCSWRAQFPSADSSLGPMISRVDETRLGGFYSETLNDRVVETIFGDRPRVTGLRLNLVIPAFGPTNGLQPGAQLLWNVLVNDQEVGMITLDPSDIGPLEFAFGPFGPINGPDYTVRLEVAADVPEGMGSVNLGYAGARQGYATFTSEPEIAIDAYQRGGWDSDGYHEAAFNNTFTGYAAGIGVVRNSYLSFQTIRATGALDTTLRLEVSGYAGPDPSETFNIYQVTTPPATLEADGVNPAVFDDLQDGTLLGSFTVTPSDVGKILEIPLVDINKTNNMRLGLDSVISLGIHCTTAVMGMGSQGASFSIDDEARTHQLVFNYCPYDGRPLGDFDNNGCTNLDDFLYLLDYWGDYAPIGGSLIGIADFLALLDNWNTGPGCP